MPEYRNCFVSFCIPPAELPLIDFAARERGQTRSTFIYTLVRNELRALGLLEIPEPPAPKVNGETHAA